MSNRKIAKYPHQIVELVDEFIRDGDLEGVVTMYHPDCQIAMNPEEAPMKGHDAVRAIFTSLVETRSIVNGTVTGEMINGDTAILQGTWNAVAGDGTLLGGGKSIEVAKRLENGGWVYFIDCPNKVPIPKR